MKSLVFTLGLISISGACLAQAPVVDVTQQNTTTSVTSPTTGVVTTSDLESRVAVIERISQSRSNTQQRMQQQLDMLQSDVDSIRGSIELHNHQLEKILERQRELFLELDRRFESLQGQAVVSTGNTNPSAGASTTPSTRPANTQTEQEAYQSAVNLILKENDYESAVPAFQAFLTNYPNSQLTDNAHYWLGQLLYNNQDWEAAKAQFVQVAQRFVDSPKRPDSLHKLGMIAKSQGNANLARQYFEQVIAEYPNSTSANMSSSELAKG
jgi:tol-pal system protein YbgF